MKCLVILLISVISLVAAEATGEYVPKAFYFLDEHGKPSIPQPITQETLNRVRRQIPPVPGYNPNYGGFAFPQPIFNFPQTGQPGQSSFVSSSQTLSSRFGEDEPIVTGQSQIFTSSGGKYQQTTSHLNPDGSITTNKQSGRVKRDTMSQTQSQGSGDGKTQFQSQSQNALGGTQLQSQNQPGMTQTQSQGALGENAFPIKGSFDHIQEPEQDKRPQRTDVPNHEPQNVSPISSPPSTNQDNNAQRSTPQQPQEINVQRSPAQQQQPQKRPHSQQQQQPQQRPQPQQHQINYQQGQQYPGGQPQQSYYPQGQFPFGFGQYGFPNQGFGYPQVGFGFPQAGFGFPQAGFNYPQQPVYPQPGFPIAGPVQPGQIGNLDNRFGEDEVPISGGVVTGGSSQIVTNQNGNYQITNSVLRPDGQVVTTQQSGRHYQG